MTHPSTWRALPIKQYNSNDESSIQLLLQQRGISSLKQQAGYLPLCDTNPLPKPVVLTSGLPLHSWHLVEVHQLLKTHQLLAMEWMMLLCVSQRYVPDETIPYYLRLGNRHERLQQWIKHILSDTAQWLIKQAQVASWQWYADVEKINLNTLVRTQFEAYSEIMYIINRSLERDPMSHSGNKALIKLTHFSLMWSEQITTRFLESLIVSHVVATFQERSQLVKVIKRGAYLMPIRYESDLIAELETGAVGWQAIIEHVKKIFALRRRMQAVIDEVA